MLSVRLSALMLALFIAVSQAAPLLQPRQAELSPPWPLCTATRWGNWPDRVLWRRWVIAQQADGGHWKHACAYDSGTYL